MSRSARLAFVLIVCGLASSALASDRPADQIVKDIQAIKRPTTMAEFQEGNAKKIELIGELAKSHPTDPRLCNLLRQRWIGMAQSGKTAEAIKDIDETLAKTNNLSTRLEGLSNKVLLISGFDAAHLSSAVPAAEEFIKLAPSDTRAPTVLYLIASKVKDNALRIAFEDRILKNYPSNPFATWVNGERKQKEGIGKPFELEFTDAIKGSTVSMKGLKGKVVVIGFWDTSNGLCVAEILKMKTLYAEYKDKGVEFIGVSLDPPNEKGGLDKLKKFVADNEIGWPQYYQGNFLQSKFCLGWGVNSLPRVFIVDAEGNLYSVDAGGKKLEKLIPELLGKKAKTSAGGGQ